jgi:hypothetical protein
MSMSAPSAEIYRTTRKSACEERALVLAAVGIPSSIRVDGGLFLLEVEDALAQAVLSRRHPRRRHFIRRRGSVVSSTSPFS